MDFYIKKIHPRSLKFFTKELRELTEGRLWLKILIGMFLGIVLGIAMGPTMGIVDPETATTIGEWVAFPGLIFLGLLQMIVVPLVFASIIRGISASESIEQLRKTGTYLVIFVVATTTLAIGIGMILTILVGPGHYITSDTVEQSMEPGTFVIERKSQPTMQDIPQLVGGVIPINPLGSMVRMEMLQVVIFSILLGVAVISIPIEQSKPILDLLGSVQVISIQVVSWAMRLAPLAVFGLIAKLTVKLGFDALIGMAVYVGTVLMGLLTILVVYLAIALIVSGRGPWKFLGEIREVQLLAFSTSSSAAVMPLSIKTAEEKLGIRPSLAQFIIPLGATINMAGTALYQGVATIFLAQVFAVDLSISQLLFIILTVVGTSIGSPATPGMGIVILALVLNSVGIPTSGIALILGVDRILDMSRTVVNVTGDLTACIVLERFVKVERTAEQQLIEEKKREKLRRASGEDVIIR